MKHMTEAVEVVRRRENRSLADDGDARPQADEGALEHPQGKRAVEATRRTESASGYGSQDGSHPGHQGEVAAPAVLPDRMLGSSFLRRLVRLGGPQTPRAGKGRRSDARKATRQRDHRLQACDHQRHRGGAQQQVHGHQSAGWRLPNSTNFKTVTNLYCGELSFHP
jgi:hypothetical protein